MLSSSILATQSAKKLVNIIYFDIQACIPPSEVTMTNLVEKTILIALALVLSRWSDAADQTKPFQDEEGGPRLDEVQGEDTFIVGGIVPEDPIAWIVFPTGANEKKCAGSLVSPDTVVTAAHCYADCNNVFFDCNDPCPTQVNIGSSYRATTGVVEGQVVDVVPYSCVLHPNYERLDPDLGLGSRFDVATYKLTRNVSVSKYPIVVTTPGFPTTEWSGESGFQRNSFRAYGFGRFSNVDSSGSERLRLLGTSYWENCGQYEGGIGVYEEQHHICTWRDTLDEGLCLGDSGGPLVIAQKDGREFLVGIASFLGSQSEDAPCASNSMDFFTRISSYHEWIQVRGTHGI